MACPERMEAERESEAFRRARRFAQQITGQDPLQAAMVRATVATGAAMLGLALMRRIAPGAYRALMEPGGGPPPPPG